MELKDYEYYRTDLGVLYKGDCLEILPLIDKVDLVLTDPPYGMNNNVDSSRFSGGTAGHIAKRGNGGRFKENIIGDNKEFDPTPFMRFNKKIFWGYNHFSKKLPVGTTLVWIKKLDSAFGKFLSDAEIAWMSGGCGVYCKTDISLLKETRNRKHPNQKPINIIIWCIELSKTTGLIFDPYAGSGTTAVACEKLGRRWIGIEISEKYCEIAKQRIKNEADQFKMY